MAGHVRIPRTVLALFQREAMANVAADGLLNETLCFLTGVETDGITTVTDIIFPAQIGGEARVDDQGKLCNQPVSTL